MTGKITAWANAVLECTFGKTDMPAAGTVYAGLLTAVGSNDGTGFTEVSASGYARISLAGLMGAAAGNPANNDSEIKNTGTVTFFTPTSDPGVTVLAIGYFDALTGGNMRTWGYVGDDPWLPFTGSSASPCVLTVPGHGYANGDKVAVISQNGASLPPTAGSWSGLLTVANVTTNTFTLGVNSTGVGSGQLRKVTPLSLWNGAGVTLVANANGLVGTES